MRRRSPGIARTVLLTALLLAAATAHAQQARVVTATVVARDGWLVADLALVDLIDRRTASTIDSGLSGVCAYEVDLLGPGGEPVARRSWTLRLEYDVWEDRYQVRGAEGAQEVASIQAMGEHCGQVAGLRLAPLDELDTGAEHRLRVVVQVWPLGAEAEDRLTRYLSRRGGEAREELDLDLGSLFARVFGGGGREASTTVSWTGEPFRPAALPAGPREAAR
jgi:hypothetical protein